MFESVLLVDDDSISTYITKLLLKNLRISKEIEVVKNGLEALEKITDSSSGKQLPELIILDLYMPVMDGIEFLELFRTLQSRNRDKCIIMVLSSSIVKEESKLRDLGVSYIAEKPLSIQTITSIMQDNQARLA